jgi:hypothetical protein
MLCPLEPKIRQKQALRKNEYLVHLRHFAGEQGLWSRLGADLSALSAEMDVSEDW